MRTSVFLSYPQPYLKRQKDFVCLIIDYLRDRGFEPRTLGVTDYDINEPLAAIRRLMLESNGLITIAFRRNLIKCGISKPDSYIGQSSYEFTKTWLTSPYCQIEPAMAFQLGLPILILREKGVIAEGILEKGVTGTYLPEFNLENSVPGYLNSEEWRQLIGKWEGYVRNVSENKGRPPNLY